MIYISPFMAKLAQTTENTYLVTWTVEPGEDGKRLDLYLKSKYSRLSRESLKRGIQGGMVMINREKAKPARLLRLQDQVSVLTVKKNEPEVDFNYEILYEDQSLLLINKPGNLPVHPSGRYFFNTLLTQLRVKNKNELDQSKNFHVIHRIDRETSGVIVLAKTEKAAAHLVEQFANRETKKEYLAIVKGVMPEDRYVINAPLARDPHAEIRLKMHVVQLGADGNPLFLPQAAIMPASTIVEVEERLEGFTLLRCKPHTGRQHQIRVHLEHMGYPIVGDKLYGTSSDVFLRNIREALSIEVRPGLSLSRHALHAHRLSFRHPDTNEMMVFHAPLPKELLYFLNKVR